MRAIIALITFFALPLSALAIERPMAVDAARDHIRGPADARISLIEYSDYQCTHCRRLHATLTRLLRQERKNVRWVFRHYPLPAHPLARTAAHAAECAAAQKNDAAFWRITDILFRSNKFEATAFAKSQGIDTKAFTDCIAEETYRQRVQEDIKDGVAAEVTGVPTTFLWDHETDKVYRVDGAQSIGTFKTLIRHIVEPTTEGN
jgi:protein-disulfide isomerase